MKISEACQRAGVSASTLKFYVREGLVPEGLRLGSNQTRYTEAHVQRIKLVRALIDVGELSVAAARQVLSVLDSPQASFAHVCEAAQHALGSGRTTTPAPASADARNQVGELVGDLEWQATSDNPGYELAARALDGLATIGYQPSDEFLAAYAEAATMIARADLTALASRTDPALATELMVVGTVMGDALLTGLRRLAQQHETAALFPAAPTGNEE